MGRIRFVIDTNCYVSATISDKFRRRLYDIIRKNEIDIYYSEELINEYLSVISRNKFKKYNASSRIMRFMEFILNSLMKIDIRSKVEDSRDPNDNYLLALCKDCKADYLITGDSDLLVIGQYGQTKILQLSEFINYES